MKPVGIAFIVFFLMMWLSVAIMNFYLIIVFLVLIFGLVLLNYKNPILKELSSMVSELSKSSKSSQPKIPKLDISKILEYFSINETTKKHEVKLLSVKSNRLISLFEPILCMKKLERIDQKIIEYTKNSIIKTGISENPRIASKKMMAYSLLLFIVSIPISLLFAIFVDVMFIAGILAPFAYFMGKRMITSSRISERNTSIVYELPFFLTYTTIMESLKVKLYDSMMGILRTDISVFPIIKKECLMLQSFTDDFGNDYTKGFRYLAQTHPNKDFRDFLTGYLFSMEGGGTPLKELEKRSFILFEKLKLKLENYASSIGSTLDMLQIGMIGTPIGIMMIGFIAPVGTAIQVSLLAVMAFPVIAVFVILMVDSKQLKFENYVKGNVLFLPVGLGSGVAAFFITGQLYMGIGVGAFAAGFINYLLNREQLLEISELESGTPEILKMLSNDKQSKIPIIETFEKLKDTKINNSTSRLIVMIHALLINGKDMIQIVNKLPISSWLSRFSFFNIARIQESGGGTAIGLYNLSLFLDDIYIQRKKLQGKLSDRLLFAYLGPVIAIIIKIILISSIADWSDDSGNSSLSNISSEAQSMGISMIDIAVLSIPDELLTLLDVLIIMSSITMGLITYKIYNETLKNTFHMSIIVLITVVALYLTPVIQESFIDPIF